jgi:ribosomal protein L37AE/L43A
MDSPYDHSWMWGPELVRYLERTYPVLGPSRYQYCESPRCYRRRVRQPHSSEIWYCSRCIRR